MGSPVHEAWERLDPSGPPSVVWAREPVVRAREAKDRRVAVLLGAFDPLTNAHLEIVDACARAVDASPALLLTKVLLDRPDERLLDVVDRIDVLCAVAERLEIGLAFANRGTYLDVGRALRAGGFDATFIVGADKLAQLADAAFYADGETGVASTFDELRFVVIPRGSADIDSSGVREIVRGPGLRVLPAAEVFSEAPVAAISGTEVRRLHRAGAPVDHLVPPEVAFALRGYTSDR